MDGRTRRMWKWSAVGLALVVGASAAVETVAVGASAPEIAATAKVKPCGLLAVEELETLFGTPFATPEPLVFDPDSPAARAGEPQTPTCTFATADDFPSPGSPPAGSISLSVEQGKKAKADFKYALASRARREGDPERYEGFGGKYFFFPEFEGGGLVWPAGILILRKKTFLTIGGSIHGYPDAPQFVDLGTLEELAATALNRL